MTSIQVEETSVTINNSPSQDHYTNPDDHPTTNVSHNQQQSFSGSLHKPGRSTNHKRQSQSTTVLLRIITQTRTINQPQASVTINNSPSQDHYTNPDDQPTTNVSHNQQQSFSGSLHKPGRSPNDKQPTNLAQKNIKKLSLNHTLRRLRAVPIFPLEFVEMLTSLPRVPRTSVPRLNELKRKNWDCSCS